ncbi:MAG: hypothetical protein K2M43_02935, partial [Mycoplasmoidaceae bacterium]|nr:hypothetical protein [Mycoplasmoidaceae bacterium]
NKVFQDLLQKELNILFFISKKNKTDLTNANKLVAKFNELSKLDFKIDESYQPTDDDQIVDDINYLTIYVKNIFKVELKDLAKLDVKVAEQQVQQEDAPKPNNANPYAAYMGAMASAMGGANNPYADALMQGPAMMRVQSEIRSGKVFAYKNKSKVIL